MTALRHHPKSPLFVTEQVGHKWICSDGRELINLSGASLTQTLILGRAHLPTHLATNVTPSSGFDSPIKLEAEAAVLDLLPWAGALLWSSSGSDAIEQAVWAVDLQATLEHGRGVATVIVRSGSYHGNTMLGRALSNRGVNEARIRKIGSIEVLLVEETREPRPMDFLSALQECWEQGGIRAPTMVLLEPFPTSGRNFVPDEGRLAALLAWCKERGIYVVFDEVAGGAYRHGMFSICGKLPSDLYPAATVLSKGLTCGAYPLSVAALSTTLASTVRRISTKPLSFTYSLSELGAAIMVKVLATHEELCRKGDFVARRECMKSLCDELICLGLEAEHTSTTVRIAGELVHISELAAQLAIDGFWVYVARASLRADACPGAAFTDFAFLHICPPMNLAHQVVQQQCRAALDSIACAYKQAVAVP